MKKENENTMLNLRKLGFTNVKNKLHIIKNLKKIALKNQLSGVKKLKNKTIYKKLKLKNYGKLHFTRKRFNR